MYLQGYLFYELHESLTKLKKITIELEWNQKIENLPPFVHSLSRTSTHGIMTTIQRILDTYSINNRGKVQNYLERFNAIS